MRTRIKFCGITRPADAELAVTLGVDALGFVFHPASPRAIDLPTACDIAASLPPYVAKVAVFVSAEPARVQAIVNRLRPDLVQFHGNAVEAELTRYGLPYIKAIGMLDAQLDASLGKYPRASAILLDTHASGEAGGTGRVFDWTLVPRLQRPMVLAGGLRPDNVAAAVRQLRPYALDVASGIEFSPGIKSPDRMRAFVEEVQRADQT